MAVEISFVDASWKRQMEKPHDPSSDIRNVFAKDHLRAQAHCVSDVLTECNASKSVNDLAGFYARILIDDGIYCPVDEVSPNAVGQFVPQQDHFGTHAAFKDCLRNAPQSAANIVNPGDSWAGLEEFTCFLSRADGILPHLPILNDLEMAEFLGDQVAESHFALFVLIGVGSRRRAAS